MTVSPLGQEPILGQADSSQRQPGTEFNSPTHGEDAEGLAISSDKVSISPEARQQFEARKGEARGQEESQDKQDRSVTSTMGTSENAEKEDAVIELEETNSDIKKKEDEIQEAKTTFIGSEEEKARKLKELKQDLDDLEDTKKELQSTLVS